MMWKKKEKNNEMRLLLPVTLQMPAMALTNANGQSGTLAYQTHMCVLVLRESSGEYVPTRIWSTEFAYHASRLVQKWQNDWWPRYAVAVRPMRLTKSKSFKKCMFFIKGICSKGQDCRFNHDKKTPKNTPSPVLAATTTTIGGINNNSGSAGGTGSGSGSGINFPTLDLKTPLFPVFYMTNSNMEFPQKEINNVAALVTSPHPIHMPPATLSATSAAPLPLQNSITSVLKL
jgi:hypothetical protein